MDRWVGIPGVFGVGQPSDLLEHRCVHFLCFLSPGTLQTPLTVAASVCAPRYVHV